MKTQLWILSFFVSLSFTLTSTPAEAIKVHKVKGKKVLINLQGSAVKKGQVFRILNSKGKTTGLVKVKAVKGNKAIGLLKGKARSGQKLTPRKKMARRKKPMEEPEEEVAEEREERREEKKENSGSFWGLIVGYNQTTAEVGGLADEISGNGFSIKALFDFPLFEMLWFRGMSGLEQFNADSNDTTCSGGCSAEINYLTADFWGRLVSGESSKYWVGAGFDLLVPMSKDSNAIDESKITNTSLFAVGAGVDFMMDSGSYIPIMVEYAIYPKSDSVEATAMAFRIGYATPF